jgi:Lysyl-tRNA synthetase (class II)
MLESFAAREGLNEVVKNRVVKSCDLLDAGVPLFPNDFRKEHDIAWVLDKFGNLEGEALDGQEDVFAIAGRIVSLRSFGKVAFFHIMDQTGRIQCYASREHMEEIGYTVVKKLDVGDIVGVSGHLFRTKTGELTIACRKIKLITRSMLAAANQLEEAVGIISSASSQLSAQIDESDHIAAESAQRLSEAATAMNEMNATVQEVARNASSASAVSAETRTNAEGGAKIVEQALQSIGQVHTVSLALKDDMGRTLELKAGTLYEKNFE